jgi:hypothetical protein
MATDPLAWLRLYEPDSRNTYHYRGQSIDIVEHIIDTLVGEFEMYMGSSAVFVWFHGQRGHAVVDYARAVDYVEPSMRYVQNRLATYARTGSVTVAGRPREYVAGQNKVEWSRFYVGNMGIVNVEVYGVADFEGVFHPEYCEILNNLEYSG